MTRLLIIADDFTGALDTGVQFASLGITTKVTLYDESLWASDFSNIQVLVVNAETRHMRPEQAYECVFSIAQAAQKNGFSHLYKKTDSALRGNIGAELSAALAAWGEQSIHFVPAFPQIKRTTRDGIHYIDQQPVSESVFSQDPFEPVTHSNVIEVIASQSKTPAYVIKRGEKICGDGIGVYDCETDQDMIDIAGSFGNSPPKLLAGCASFAVVLADLFHFDQKLSSMPKLNLPLLVVCGSINPITAVQLDYAQQHGAYRARLSPEQKLEENYFMTDAGKGFLRTLREQVKLHDLMIVDTNSVQGDAFSFQYLEEKGGQTEKIREKISDMLGLLLCSLLETNHQATLLVTGGDTLMGFLKHLGCHTLTPICELFVGVVLSRIEHVDQNYYIISKSGGFGGKTLLTDIMEKLTEFNMEMNVK